MSIKNLKIALALILVVVFTNISTQSIEKVEAQGLSYRAASQVLELESGSCIYTFCQNTAGTSCSTAGSLAIHDCIMDEPEGPILKKT